MIPALRDLYLETYRSRSTGSREADLRRSEDGYGLKYKTSKSTKQWTKNGGYRKKSPPNGLGSAILDLAGGGLITHERRPSVGGIPVGEIKSPCV